MKILQVMARVHVPPEALDATIAFYERLSGETCQIRFRLAAANLEIAAVAGMHIVAGTNDALAPFAEVRAAFFVDSVAEFQQALASAGAEIVRAPQFGPQGMFMVVRHPDGLVVEYADNAKP